MPTSLAGQRVVIIGGSSGLGLATAALAREHGATVTIAGRSEDKLREASAALGEADTASVDISDESSVAALFAPYDHIDHLIITAGTLGPSGVTQQDLPTLQSVLEQRLWGAIYAVRAAAPKMTAGGSITLTSGGIAARPRAGAAMISVALAAVEALAPALALELAPVRVNCITPGVVLTPLQGSGPEAEARVAERGKTLPVGRAGNVDDLAQAYLMAMTNGYLTGEVLHIDGGGRWL